MSVTGNSSPLPLKDLPAVCTDPRETAKEAGLKYVTDEKPGIRRRRAGKGFTYVGPDGSRVTDKATLDRIKSLVIPPAYRDVWISPVANGHIQATGLDDRGRKQYRYHPKWIAARDETKFSRMALFAKALPGIRARVAKDLARPGMPREKILAAMVQLLEKTVIRVGNEEYAKQNGSYGLTTMRNRHAKVEGTHVKFHFRGKSGKWNDIDLQDRRLSNLIKKLQDLPGQELFQYVDENGESRTIDSGDVNAYIKEVSGEDFTAKDFRTWAGTVLASLALQEFAEFETAAAANRNLVTAVKAVAGMLGNTPAVCKKAYIHPAVIESYLDGSMLESLKQQAEQELTDDLSELKPEEAAVVALLRRKLAGK